MVGIIALLVIEIASKDVIYIKPDNKILDCSNTTCFSISYVLENISLYAETNTILQFDSGVYEINHPYGNILITSVQNLTIRGAVNGADNTATTHIVCHQPLAFSFVQVDHLVIQNINFDHCGSPVTTTLIKTISQMFYTCIGGPGIQVPPCDPSIAVQRSMIAVFHSSNIYLQKVQIQRTNGVGLFTMGIYESLKVNNTYLLKNTVNCIIATIPPELGTQIRQGSDNYHMYNSVFEQGNISDYRTSSGLNLIFSDLESYHPEIYMINVTSSNNIGTRGNLVIEIDVCHETATKFKVTDYESSYKDASKAKGKYSSSKTGIFIKTICYLHQTQVKSRIDFTFKKTLLNSSGIS